MNNMLKLISKLFLALLWLSGIVFIGVTLYMAVGSYLYWENLFIYDISQWNGFNRALLFVFIIGCCGELIDEEKN